MKKIYMQPSTDEVKIQIENLMNFGASNGDGNADGGGNKGDLGDGDEVLSRRSSSLWDDDED